MSEELYFNNELRNCLDAAVYSDCGENDQWNYWYQRLRKAHDAAVDRVTETQRAENESLRELVRDMYACISHANEQDWFYFERDKLGCGMSCAVNGENCGLSVLADRMRELGVEV